MIKIDFLKHFEDSGYCDCTAYIKDKAVLDNLIKNKVFENAQNNKFKLTINNLSSDYLYNHLDIMHEFLISNENLLDLNCKDVKFGLIRICLNHDGIPIVESYINDSKIIPIENGDSVYYVIDGIFKDLVHECLEDNSIINNVEKLYDKLKDDLDISIEIQGH